MTALLLLAVGCLCAQDATGLAKPATALRQKLASMETVGSRDPAAAALMLGKIQLYGIGGTPDAAAGRQWIILAASKGSADARFEVGRMVEDNSTSASDIANALAWYRSAATAGSVSATVRLGDMAAQGKGGAADPAAAATWYELAAERRSPIAAIRLGDLYASGKGVPKDLEKACGWYLVGAALNDQDALEKIAALLNAGSGQGGNTVEILAVVERMGSPETLAQLGQLFESGRAGQHSQQLAYLLFRLAADRGSKTASKAADELDRTMRYESATQVGKRGVTWRPGSSR